jgi:hypothetical protein
VSALLLLISFNGFFVFLTLALCGAATVMSLCLLDAGVRRYLPGDSLRMAILSAGYGVQLALVLTLVFDLFS